MKQNDLLTGLPGREALREALNEALKERDSVALAVLDVDRFDAINVNFGAETGDRTLQVIAEVVAKEMAEGPTGVSAYRLSGDEFALLLPNLTLEQAFLRMEGLRTRVQEAAERIGLPDKSEVTVTVGVANYPRDARDEAGLLKAADAALMNAKEQGRNAVGLPPNEEMVLKSCYYASASVRKLKALAERTGRKESALLREALGDLLHKYDTAR